MTEKLTILGSTGSIGTQALDVVDMRGYEVVALTADSNYKLLEQQIRKYKPLYAAMADEKAAKELQTLVKDTSTKVFISPLKTCALPSLSRTNLSMTAV